MPEPSTTSRPVRTIHDLSANPHTQKRNRSLMWTAVTTVGVVVFVIALGAIDGADGQPMLSGKLVEVTLIQVGAVSAILWPILLRTSKSAAAVQDQVQNSHSGVMRDDMDAKHDQLLDRIQNLWDRMENRFEAGAADVRGIRKDLGRHADKLDTHDEELKELRKRERALERKVGDEPHP